MTKDFDVNDFMGSDFVQKDDLKADGPRRLRIKDVEQREGLPKDGKVAPELVLIFTDESKFGLRARTNKETLREAFGRHTTDWIGKVIELYVDPTVRNPSGQKVGGIRIRIPDDDGGPVDFTSDLEGATDEAEQANPEKVAV